MKRICIALDTSPSAEKVAQLGFEYATALNAKITLVHVVNDPAVYTYDYDPIMGYDGFFIQQGISFVEDLKQEAEKFLNATVTYLGDDSIDTAVLEGDTHIEIMQFVKEYHADLLVLGSHSHSVLENILMGTTATKIVKHSKIPVLIVPVKNP